MGHTVQQYEDRIRSRLGDFGILQLLDGAQIPLALELALATFSKDNPRIAAQTFTGDGATYTFDLTADAAAPTFDPDWSRIISVEYPTGNRDRSYLDPHDWTVDQILGEVTLLEATPAAGETVEIRYTATWPYPTDTAGDDPIGDIWFNAVCSLAAAEVARGKGAEFARRQSNSVAGDLIQQDPTPLFEAARLLEKAYTDQILGRASSGDGPPQIGFAVTEIDHLPDALFHSRIDMT